MAVVERESAGADADAPRPMTEPVAKAARLVKEIFTRRALRLKPKPNSQKGKPRSIYASNIPDCARQGVYQFTHWKEKPDWSWELEALFEAGNNNEALYKAQLREIGIEVVDDQSSLLPDMFEQHHIGGYMDARIKFEGTRIPVEMKLMSPYMFDAIDGLSPKKVLERSITAADITAGIESMKRTVWTRKYLRQLTVYLLGTAEEVGMFALTDGRGAWKFVIVPLDYEEGERVLAKADEIWSHVQKGTEPDRITYSMEVCGRCPFAHICIPDIQSDPRLKIIDNPELEDILKIREVHLESHSKVEKVKRKLKQLFQDVEEGVYSVGSFVITRTSSDRKGYEVKPTTVFKNKIERIMELPADELFVEPRRSFLLDDE